MPMINLTNKVNFEYGDINQSEAKLLQGLHGPKEKRKALR